MISERRQNLQNKAMEFEKNQGTDNFLKVVISSMCKLMVDKNMVTKDELMECFETQRAVFEDQCQSQILDLIENGGRISPDALEEAAKDASMGIID